ncbi:MAG: SusC/RagA family TonB-linked outer membrane protein, partial [Bacteroidota bacterium]
MTATETPAIGEFVAASFTTQGMFTDENGAFSLSVAGDNITLVFRYYGFAPVEKEIFATGAGNVEVLMESDVLTLGEVVVIGYGTQKKEDLTGSIVSVSSDQFIEGNVATPEQLINGKVAGVQITPNGGAPGSGSRIRIRGGASINASNDPLIVIDGVPVDNGTINGAANPLSLINPNDIETFTVLKDASATAIYGSRASNGVIIITTKKGKAGQPLRLTFQSTLSRADKTRTVDVMDAAQFRAAVEEFGTEERIALLGDANTDWQEEIFRPAYSQDNTLSLSGSIKSVPFRASVGFLNQNGILLNSNMQRTTGSIGATPTLFDDHLRIDINLKGARVENQFADQGAIGTALAMDPTKPVRSGNDDFGGFYEWLDPSTGNPNTLAPRNPVGLLEQKDDLSTVLRSIGNAQLDYRFHFLPEMRANLNLGYDISSSEGSVMVPVEAASTFDRTGQNRTYSQQRTNTTLEFYLNYVKNLESIASNIDIMAGYSYQDFIRESEELDVNLVTPVPDTFNNPIPFKTQNTLVSFFGRLNYELKDRYLLTLTLRQDGSSRFSPETRWGLFPSAALAWKLTEEAVVQKWNVFSDLKLRLGYGVTGQQDVLSDYPYLPRYTPSETTAQYPFGGNFVTTLRPEAYDANIKWEETTTYNVGLDFGFWGDRITASVDYYVKQTRDLLNVIPVSAGSNFANQILTNVGEIENEGVEVSANIALVQTDDVDLNFGMNFTYNENTITKLTQVPDSSFLGLLVGGISGGVGNTIQVHSVGFPTFSYFVQEQVYDDQGNPIEGEYVDRNGDGEVTLDDRYRTFSPNPAYFFGLTGGFRYKAFNASFVLRGNLGQYVYNNVR